MYGILLEPVSGRDIIESGDRLSKYLERGRLDHPFHVPAGRRPGHGTLFPRTYFVANGSNPHYLDANPEGHAGETREQRILEYITANPRRYVVGLREGCMLHYENGKLELIGSRPMRIFKKGIAPYEVKAGDDLSFLL